MRKHARVQIPPSALTYLNPFLYYFYVDGKKLILERYSSLTPIQQLTFEPIRSGKNVLICAPTGSGKTEAALLPAMEKAVGGEPISILYITPLRALSRDITERIAWWCERAGLTYGLRTGDTSSHERSKHRKKPPYVLLTTVESLQALLMGRVMRKHLSNVKFVIVDEVHDILDNKRGAQLSLALERLAEIADFRRIALSATLADKGEAAKLIFGERDFVLCEPSIERKFDFSVEPKNIERIAELCRRERTLLFVNTRSTAEELAATLIEMEVPIAVHHGSLSKNIRIATEKDFKEGRLNSVLCTSSLELGIDVGDANLVIQYGSPHQVFRLIQRVGRAGHSLSKVPKGVLFYSDEDDRLECEVIKDFALSGKLEEKRVEKGALDVIAHQVVGMLLENGRMDLWHIHSILSRSYAYGISFEKLKKIALQLLSERLVFYDEEGGRISLRATRRARHYYYTFLSTIPKEKKFALIDMSSRKPIASLDEEFVVNLEVGDCFLAQGKPWRVVDIGQEEVVAERWVEQEVMIPSWTGEDIPVSYEVAQEVGRRRKGEEPLPNHRRIIIEKVDEIVVLHACFGHRVNEVLGRIIAHKLSSMMGEHVFAVIDPYRIMIKLPFLMDAEYIKKALLSIEDVERSLREALADSSLLRFKFQHVARLFGLLSPEGHASMRYISALKNSVVYEETLRSIFFRYFDVERASEVLERLRSGDIELVVDERKELSFYAKLGLERASGGESVGVFSPKTAIISAFMENFNSKLVELLCLSCHASRLYLFSSSEDPLCHLCGSSYVAPKDCKDQESAAALIHAHGKRALLALSTYGIGPKAARRLLKKLHRTEEEFILDLINEQRNFVKNKKFWKR